MGHVSLLGDPESIGGHNFAVIGVAGYIAPRHLDAIKWSGNHVVAALDKSDSVGVIDRWFPEAEFFTEFERFDRHVEKLRRGGIAGRVDYVSICSPNYLHDAHMRFALRVQAHAICEKPLVINVWNIDALEELERESGRRVYCVLQLRHHPAIVALRDRISKEGAVRRYLIDLTYITARGRWYFVSWKGSLEKSGGIATNIGIHFFDMLMWIFGGVQNVEVYRSEPTRMAGFLRLEKADVRWVLSLERGDLPEDVRRAGKSTYRSVVLDGEEIEFSEGFTELHRLTYQEILSGRGFGISEARPSIELVSKLRSAEVQEAAAGRAHPLLRTLRVERSRLASMDC